MQKVNEQTEKCSKTNIMVPMIGGRGFLLSIGSSRLDLDDDDDKTTSVHHHRHQGQASFVREVINASISQAVVQ